MNLFFLPAKFQSAIACINFNFLNEIRIRTGQPVIIQYGGEYKYINTYGIVDDKNRALICEDSASILYSAMEGSIYAYSEQLKNGFITVGSGVRIGVAGEYVESGDKITAVKNVTSLNIRIPHEADGCGREIYEFALKDKLNNLLVFSPPGYGKTTVLRSIAKSFESGIKNILVYDERNEISGTDGTQCGFNLGSFCDVVRGADKLSGFSNAVRALSPHVIVTDELYGDKDFNAVKFAAECGICVIASSHICEREILKTLPFDFFVELTGIGKQAVIYDKAFNIVRYCNTVRSVGNSDI